MNELRFGPLEHLALIGASPLFHALVAWGRENGVKTTILTSPDQAPQMAGLDLIMAEKLTPDLREKHFKRCGLALSFGARWIMKEKIRHELFYDNIVNCHATRLPFDRGGGNWSYRAMRQDRLGCLMLHKIDDGIDTGPVVCAKEYVIPPTARTPAAIRYDCIDRLRPFIIEFLSKGLRESASFPLSPLPPYLGTYFPRLLTAEHGWIDWTSDPAEIERFILAFDAPYSGALTMWNETRVSLKNCQLHGGEARVHESQIGTVIRRAETFLIVALRDGWALIVETVNDDQGKSVLPAVKEGDRFSQSATRRVIYGPNGRR